MPRIIIEKNPLDLARRGAELFATIAQASVKETGRFLTAISGGSTPRSMHRLLAEEPYHSRIPWDKIHLFWVDERCVPAKDEASNYGTAKTDFLDRVPIPPKQIYPMPVQSPDGGAESYQNLLKALLPLNRSGFPVFDLIFLGVGTDGHTASLFPGQGALEERNKAVLTVKGGKPNVYRFTLTYPVLNAGKHIIFLVSGSGKAEILKKVIQRGSTTFPAQQINPTDGTLTWLLDQEAASLLQTGRA